MTITVLVVDDQTLVRRGFRLMLEAHDDLTVVGEAADGVECVAQAARLSPDVVVMDVRMPRMDGIGATIRLLRLDPAPRVLVLTTFDVDEYVVGALRAGASGYLLKDVEPDDLADAVRAAAAGTLPLAPAVLRRVVDGYLDRARPVRDRRLDRLTARELEVLALLGEGLSNAEISARLVVSMPTTKTHVASILAKLDLRDRVQAAILAHRCGLLPDQRRTRTVTDGDELRR